MSASQHFLFPLISRWQDHSTFPFVDAVVKSFLDTLPFCLLSSPSVTLDFHHIHIQDLTLQCVPITGCLSPRSCKQQQPSWRRLWRGIRFCKLLPIKQIAACSLILHWCRSTGKMIAESVFSTVATCKSDSTDSW